MGYAWDTAQSLDAGAVVLAGQSRGLLPTAMICKTVGSAYVGSNPTPATS